MLSDYHIHTYLCKHADGSPEEYLDRAKVIGLDEICFTDHAPDPNGYDPGNRMHTHEYSDYADIVSEMQKNEYGINVLYGIEADYYEGGEEFLRPWLLDNDFDLVLGSVHYISSWGFDDPSTIAVWETADVLQTWTDYFQLLGEMAETGMYDIASHLDLPKKFKYRPKDESICELAANALDKISSANMAIELNTGGLRRPCQEIYPSIKLLRMARERDIPITFGSDAHQPEDVGSGFDKALALAKEAGYHEYVRFKKREKYALPLPANVGA
ncbi:hypothetical protein BVX97_01735 [bacterium E08(2017)]|nr:hypothetical protein BVX97_01735 [bacterium E08(2017)]